MDTKRLREYRKHWGRDAVRFTKRLRRRRIDLQRTGVDAGIRATIRITEILTDRNWSSAQEGQFVYIARAETIAEFTESLARISMANGRREAATENKTLRFLQY